MGQGAEDAGESEGRPVIGRIGQMPVPKGSPLPAGVTEREAPALHNLPGR